MELVEIYPHLHMVRYPAGQAYLWRDGGEFTVVDPGPPGAEEDVAEALRTLGHSPAALRRIVLTHFHADHAGAAGALAARHSVPVLAHRLDAPVVRGELAPPAPDFTGAPEWERHLFERVHSAWGLSAEHPVLPSAPPCPVDQELEDGDVLGFGGGAWVVGTPGHTDGSVALHLPAHATVFTGDAAARAEGREEGPPAVDGARGVFAGVFHRNREHARASFRRLSGLDADTVCFGHGPPLAGGGAGALFRAAAACG